MSEETQIAPDVSENITDSTEATDANNDDSSQEEEVLLLNGKFKSVSELTNSYEELQSAFTKKMQEYSEKLGAFTGAPEQYELPEGVEVTPRLETFMNLGKELQINNEALTKFIEADAEASKQAMEQYVAEQKELLGNDAEIRLNNLTDWAKANLGEDYMEDFKGMIVSAKGVEMMEKLMKQTQGTQVASAPAQPSIDKDTLKQMRFAKDEFGNRKMSVDPEYRARVEKLEAEFLKSGGKI